MKERESEAEQKKYNAQCMLTTEQLHENNGRHAVRDNCCILLNYLAIEFSVIVYRSLLILP
jgi:hypothetical protein